MNFGCALFRRARAFGFPFRTAVSNLKQNIHSKHVEQAAVVLSLQELTAHCSNAGLANQELHVVIFPTPRPAHLAHLRFENFKFSDKAGMSSTAGSVSKRIVLEGIAMMSAPHCNGPSSNPIPESASLNVSAAKKVTHGLPNKRTDKEKAKDAVHNGDARQVQKPIEGWTQSIANGSGKPGLHNPDDEDELACFDDVGSDNIGFAYRHYGFKRINIVNFEADGHVIVQVLESSFKLFEMAKFVYDETKPVKVLLPNRWYFAKVLLADGAVYGNRAEYKGELKRDGFVKMYFADIGQTESVRREHVYEIANYSDAADLPIQAVKVSVAGLTNMGYSVEELHGALDSWVNTKDTLYMLRAKPPKKEKYIERITGVPRVLITNHKGQILGVWKRQLGCCRDNVSVE